MIEEYEKILKEKMKKNQIQGYEIYYEETKSINIISKLNKIKRSEWDYDSGIGIRVIVDRHVGFSSGQRIEDAEKVIHNAISTSKFNPVINTFSFAPKSKPHNINYDSVDYDDEDGIISKLKEYIMTCLSVDGHIESYSSVSFGKHEIINSEGVNIVEDWDSEVSLSTVIKQGDMSVSESLSLPTFNDRFYDIPNIAKRNAEIKQNGKHMKFDGTVVLDSDALYSLLSFYLSSFTGIRRHYKTVKYDVGDSVACDRLTVIDDPLNIQGTERSRHDTEGVPSEKREIVKNGMLRMFAYNREYAALDNLNINEYQGFCARSSYSNKPTIGFSNIIIPSGNDKIDELDNVAIIRSVFGLHTANPISGRFGLPIDNGYVLRNGEKIGLKDVMLSGNIFEGLKNVVAIGNKQNVNGSYIVPWLAIDGWTIL